MTGRWLGYSAASERGELVRALRSIDPQASISFAHNADELRSMVLGHNRGRLGVIVGLTDSGVSAVNLAAALARDGVASEVVLVARNASGSLKSRALSAGISDVIDVTLLPKAQSDWDIDEPDLPSEVVPTTVLMPSTPDPSIVPEMTDVRRRNLDQRLPRVGREERWPGQGRESQGRRASGTPPARGRHAAPTGAGRDAWSGQWHVVEGRNARSHLAGPPSTGAGKGPILTFVSGRGGVGKTSLAATEAAIAASWGMRVALCDLDLSCGNLYSCFGLGHGSDLAQLEGKAGPYEQDIQRLGEPAMEGVRLWGPCERPEMAEVVMPHVTSVLRVLADRYDIVLVDTSTTFTDAVAQAAQASDRLLLVSDGGSGTAVALSRLGALAVRLGVARTRIVRISNRCDLKGRDEVVLNRASVGLETARSLRVLEGGEELSEIMAAGRAADVMEAVPVFGRSAASALAKVLSEMGRLPGCDEALRAARDEGVRRRRLFGRRREVG